MSAVVAEPRPEYSPTAAVAAFGLPGAPVPPPTPLAAGEWAALLTAVAAERIEGLLAAAAACGALTVDQSQHDDLRSAAWGRARVDLELERELLIAGGVLSDAGVGFRVLKGQAWAHTAYPDPSWRGAGDVDLLVGDDDWYRAVEALEAAGAQRALPEIRPGFDRRFGKDATLITQNRQQVDLHRALVFGPYGLWIDQTELLARSAKVTIGEVSLLTLDPEASFVHACLNLVLADDPPRLIAARDVAEMVFAGNADSGAVADLARRWRSEAVIVEALSAAGTLLGVELWDQPLAAPFITLGVGAWSRALMATYRGPGRGYSSQAAAVVALHGARDRMAYLRALARPQAAYLEARGVSAVGFLRRAANRLRGPQ